MSRQGQKDNKLTSRKGCWEDEADSAIEANTPTSGQGRQTNKAIDSDNKAEEAMI
jgi:hypothetical protein